MTEHDSVVEETVYSRYMGEQRQRWGHLEETRQARLSWATWRERKGGDGEEREGCSQEAQRHKESR